MAEKAKADKVDLNTASRDDLVAVPGIGDAGADAIVKHREERGRFHSVDDLVEVPGIGAATLETARAHLTASRKGEDGGVAAKRAGERSAEMTKKAGEAGPEVLERAGESAAEGASRPAHETVAAARNVAAGAAEVAHGTGASGAEGRDQLLVLTAESMEDVARAGQVVLDRTSELSRIWVSFWSQQLTDGMEAMRALAACRTWHEALEVQGEFTRASFERAWSRTAQSAELTAEIMAGGLRPLQASTQADRAAPRRRVV